MKKLIFSKSKNLHTLYNFLVATIIFLAPTNFFLKFFESQAYVNGLKIDYLISKLYLSDVFILFLLGTWFVFEMKNKRKWWKKFIKKLSSKPKKNSLLIVLMLVFVVRQLWSDYPIAAFSYLLRIIELGFFASFLVKHKNIISKILFEKAVISALIFQSSIAIYQYIHQKSLFGYLLLGEPNLQNYIGVAKSTVFGAEKILPYGTTAHPNVLGGFLAFYLLFLLNKILKNVKEKIGVIEGVAISLSLFALFLTQSISAILTLMLGTTVIFYQNYFKNKKQWVKRESIFSITIVLIFLSIFSISFLSKKYPENTSLNRRNYLNTASMRMVRDNIVAGVGLNNFTAQVERYSSNREVVRFVQPVHNIFLLFLAETGLLGIALVSTTIYKLKNLSKPYRNKNWSWIVILLPIALLDHYLLTLNSGLFLMIFSIDLLGTHRR